MEPLCFHEMSVIDRAPVERNPARVLIGWFTRDFARRLASNRRDFSEWKTDPAGFSLSSGAIYPGDSKNPFPMNLYFGVAKGLILVNADQPDPFRNLGEREADHFVLGVGHLERVRLEVVAVALCKFCVTGDRRLPPELEERGRLRASCAR